MTSFDVIRVLRKKTGIKKFGHAGTLDPLATGLMILGVEKGTKRLTEFIKLDKEYIAEVCIGEKRTTGDMEGTVTEEKDVDEIFSSEKISSTLVAMIGTLTLPVSAYSAIKKDGKAMYKLAREAESKGETIEDVPIREMEVMSAECLGICYENKRAIITVRFHVGSGTYIRSLGEELGRKLGYPATLRSLRRTKIGSFDVKDALTLEDF